MCALLHHASLGNHPAPSNASEYFQLLTQAARMKWTQTYCLNDKDMTNMLSKGQSYGGWCHVQQ